MFASDTEGKTTSTRSRKIATSPNTATTTSGAWRWGGRPGQALEQIRERNQPAHDEHDPRQVCHGWTKKRLHEEPVSTGTLPYQITRYCDQKKYIHMIDMRELQLGHVLDGRRRDRGHAARVGADREDRQQAERRVERAHHEVAAEEAAVPAGVERHHEVEAPERDRDQPQHQQRRRPAGCGGRARARRRAASRRAAPPARTRSTTTNSTSGQHQGAQPKKNGTLSQAAFTGTGVSPTDRARPAREEHDEEHEGDRQEAAS